MTREEALALCDRFREFTGCEASPRHVGLGVWAVDVVFGRLTYAFSGAHAAESFAAALAG